MGCVSSKDQQVAGGAKAKEEQAAPAAPEAEVHTREVALEDKAEPLEDAEAPPVADNDRGVDDLGGEE
jgi:hypothetical protein